MYVAVAVRVGDFLIVDLAEPVVGGDSAGVGENESADGVGDGGVLLDAPVLNVEVLVYGLLVIQVRGFRVAQLLALLAVEYVGLGNGLIAASGEHGLDAVLNILDGDHAVLYLRQEVCRDLQRQKINDAVVIVGGGSVKRLLDCGGYLVYIEFDCFPVAFNYLIQFVIPLIFFSYTPLTCTDGTYSDTASARSCISFSS